MRLLYNLFYLISGYFLSGFYCKFKLLVTWHDGFSPSLPAAQGGRPGVRARSLTTITTTLKIKQRKSTQSRKKGQKAVNCINVKEKKSGDNDQS